MPTSSKSELDAIALLRKELEAQRLAYENKLREQAEKLREKDEKLREKDSKLREKDSKIARLEKINLAQGLLVQDAVGLVSVMLERFRKDAPDFLKLELIKSSGFWQRLKRIWTKLLRKSTRVCWPI